MALIASAGTFSRRAVCALALFALVLPLSAWAEDGPNLLLNGDLTRGAGDSPDHWRAGGWKQGGEFSTYRWSHPAGGPGELEITNTQPNDARWAQKLKLGPGWYHVSASVRTENVGQSRTGANLSLLEDGIISDDLHGTNDWRPLDFYLKVGEQGAEVEVACRLGGFAALNTGKVLFREVRMSKVAGAPADAPHKYDLDLIRSGGSAAGPAGSGSGAAVLVAALAIAAMIGLLGWRRRRGRADRATQGRAVLQHAVAQEQAAAPVADAERRRIEIILFAVALLSFTYFYQASDHSTASRIDLIRALLERRTVWIEGYAGYNTADLVQLNGHIYSNKAPGGALSGLLPWAVVTTALGAFVAPAGALYWALATYLTTVFSVSVLGAVLTVLMYRFALFLGASHGRAVALGLTLAFCTILFPYATEFTAEPIAALSVLAAFYLVARSDAAQSWRQSLAAGLLAGWSVLCDYPTFVLAAIVGLYALWKLRDPRRIGAFALGAALMAVVLLAYNQIAFGNPFFLSYEAYMLPGSDRFPEQAAGFAGITYPRLAVLWQVLGAPQRGLLFCNPVLLLAFPGLFFFWRRQAKRAELMVLAGSITSFILFNAAYGRSVIYWGGGTAIGPRHMLPAVPFMVLAMVFLPEALNPLFGALAMGSAFAMLAGTAVEPHFPYAYRNPLRDFVWPAYLRGDLAYNKSSYFGGGPIAGDSVAFNLGKLAGLPGPVQLWPLAAIWIAAALALMRRVGLRLRRAWQPAAALAAALAIFALFMPPMVGTALRAMAPQQRHGLLGRYYEGRRQGSFAPHIERVDPLINFDDIVALGSLPSPSFVVWRGTLQAPASGLYRFVIVVDDAGWLTIDGRAVIGDPGEVTRMRASGSVLLSAGPHSVEVGERNIWGGALMHLRWQPPGSAEGVVASRFLTPERAERRGD